MNDLRSLADGQGQWSGWLTPKGRLVAFFALIRLGPDNLLLWLPDGGATALRERLQRFVFRSNVKLDVRDDLAAVGCLTDDPANINAQSALARFRIAAEATPDRILMITDTGTATPLDEALEARWRLADLALGLPYIAAGADNSEQFVPQWLSLDRLDAFSVKKGCYPGQEIVARMHFLGQSKRASHRLAGSGLPPPAMARVVTSDGGNAGEIVWATAAEGGWVALAVLSGDHADDRLTLEGEAHPLQRLPD